ncbi:hypothetical protein ABLO27_00760 [Roseibium sp. SCPC15]|uniref:hypothetical protein n=1 Tax=Roseibium sp. SCP15 TaxID=3141376 RepID=UPI0033373B63
MAKAMTAVKEVCPPKGEEDERAVVIVHQSGRMNVPFMLAKNLLFWGSISLTFYGLYLVVSAL